MSDTVEVAPLLNARTRPLTLTDQDMHVSNLIDAIDAAIDGGNITWLEAEGTRMAAIVPAYDDSSVKLIQAIASAAHLKASQLSPEQEAASAELDAARRETGLEPRDLYQVSTVETINVTRLAKVIEILCEKDVLSRKALGIAGFAQADVERWLRS